MNAFAILADTAVKGSLVLAMAAAAAWMLRRRSAAARHLVWTAATAALLALPFLSATLPELRVVPAAQEGPFAVFQTFATGRGASPAASTAISPATAGTASPMARVGVSQWTIALWAAGASFGLLQMLLACAALWRLRRSARRIEAGIEESVAVMESERVGMPMTFGVFRPVVMLPAGASEWSPERLRVVLRHELAHVRRGDVATHLLARTTVALYWWNPLAWHAWREFLKERERATDDLVLEAGERASDYAAHLLEVARTLQPTTATAWAAIAMARPSELEGRLVAILDTGVSRRAWGRRAQAASIVAAIAIAAPLAAVRAQDPSIPPEAEATVRAANAQKNHEILDRAAAAYEKMAKFDVAKKMLENSLTIREGSGSTEYAAGLVKLGDLAAKRGQPAEADSFYAKAVSLGDRPEVAVALVHLGQRALGRFDRPTAENYFQRALKVEETGPNAGRALMWLAAMRQSSFGGESEAELFYQKSIKADPGNGQALINYAGLLRRQKRFDEAAEMEDAGRNLARSAGEFANGKGVYRVGNGVTAPSLLFKTEPEYSAEARAAKLQGTVLLYVEIDPDGTAQNFAVRRSLGLGLDEQSIEAVKRWKFKPGTKDGMPVTVAATIEVNWRLM